MARTFDIGRLFLQLLNLDGGPPIQFGRSQQIDPPFRTSGVVVLRLFPLRKGVAIGWWRDTGLTEEQALVEALCGRGVGLFDDDDLEDPEVRACIRENVAKATETLEDEWMIVDAFGLNK